MLRVWSRGFFFFFSFRSVVSHGKEFIFMTFDLLCLPWGYHDCSYVTTKIIVFLKKQKVVLRHNHAVGTCRKMNIIKMEGKGEVSVEGHSLTNLGNQAPLLAHLHLILRGQIDHVRRGTSDVVTSLKNFPGLREAPREFFWPHSGVWGFPCGWPGR